ncbi:urease accessory protein UreE [Chelatococcus reniformis]|uniref:Urease accessory protein UreE n=1 Tax=Chelatococcus reniformis TaxID=1494448 RepID=A0A916UX49_9HYPH|nr:urease accessory protein UreE [Chelatococcus reniformis]GGC91516.1 hypothetical protein GCM10010994_56600 [Chelatococcus reniformis]
MNRATAIVRRPAVKAERVVDTLTLDHEARQKRRVALTAEGGLELLVDLDKATLIDDGDALKLEDGRLVQVKAAAEDLLEIRAESPLRLLKAAWHIGNRHTPAEITVEALYIEADHVLAEMVRGQGCSVTPVKRPFRPERGAYETACEHDHHGHQAHGHGHGHGHDHAHEHAHASHDHHGHDHHDHDCGCGHDHHDHARDHRHAHK